ncbi:hypothetical protein AB0K12_16095 [Nonomuraea sp. NPDC049419]|uniref:hypothetical protein n=1 Tax=Nonomuraea sp. NPDC049419 TaxID=3155772 RepID=UPI00343F2E4A
MRVPVLGLPVAGFLVLMAAGRYAAEPPARVMTPRGPSRLNDQHDQVQNWYARKYQNGVNSVIATIPP